MGIISLMFPVLLLTVASTQGCQVADAGCSDQIACCGGLTCEKTDAMWGFCKTSASPGHPSRLLHRVPVHLHLSHPVVPDSNRNFVGAPSSSDYLVTKDQFTQAVTINGYGAPSDEQYENINKRAFNGKVTTKREMAMFLANILHESDGLKAKEEYQPIVSTDPAYPGNNYHGRGYIQLSHRENYGNASLALYGDLRLVQNPEQVATNDATAWDTAFWYWANHVHNRPGVTEGKFGVTIRAINGRLECDGAHKNKARLRFSVYTKILNIFVPGETPIESGCYS